jgi:hypothetical protein
MAYATNLRKYADIISQGGTPISAPAYPGTDPSVPRFLTQLINQGFAGAAGRAASRADERTKLERGNFARLIMGEKPIDVSMPKPTGLLAGLDRVLGFGDIADDGSAIDPALQALTKGKDGQIDRGAVISTATEAGIPAMDALSAVAAWEDRRRKVAGVDLAATQAQAIRTIRDLQRKGEYKDLSPEDQRTWDATLPNLPADISVLNIREEIRDATGKVIGHQDVDLWGRPVGDEKYIPQPSGGITLSTVGETEFKKKAAAAAVTQINALQEKIAGNVEIVARLDTMEALLGGDMETGQIQKVLLPIRGILAELNLLSSEDIRKLNNQEVFTAAANYIIPRMRVTGSGSSSDFEQKMFASATARMGNTPEANRIIIAGMRALDKHQREVLSMKEAYVLENGNLFGFTEEAENYFSNNPIFQKHDSLDSLAGAVADGKLDVGDLYYDNDSVENDGKKFRILSEEDIEKIKEVQ